MIKVTFQMNEAGDIQSVSSPFEPTAEPIKFIRMPKFKEISRDSLEVYLGTYELNGMEFKAYLKGDSTLTFFVPGQPEYELIPTGEDLFAIKILSGFSIKFIRDDNNEVNEVVLQQPNGNFKATRKKK